MKIQQKVISSLTVTLGSLVFIASGANGTTISDNYIGGVGVEDNSISGLEYYIPALIPTPPIKTETGTTNNGRIYKYDVDVYGDEAKYDISKMEVNASGNILTVDIYSRFLDNIDTVLPNLGDLFISDNGWNPYSPSYFDTALNGEDWEWAVTIDDYETGATSGITSLWNTSEGGTIELSDDQSFPDDMGFRPGQEVLFTADQSQTNYGAGSWAIHNLGGIDTDDFLRFEFDYSALNISTGDLGLRWSMTCANDIIEGGAPVPEPATMFMFGLGLTGLAALSKRKKT